MSRGVGRDSLAHDQTHAQYYLKMNLWTDLSFSPLNPFNSYSSTCILDTENFTLYQKKKFLAIKIININSILMKMADYSLISFHESGFFVTNKMNVDT